MFLRVAEIAKFRGHLFLRASGAPGVGKRTALLVFTMVWAVYGFRECESAAIRFRTTVTRLRNYREFGGDRRGNGRLFASFYEGFGSFRPPGVRKYRDSIRTTAIWFRNYREFAKRSHSVSSPMLGFQAFSPFLVI